TMSAFNRLFRKRIGIPQDKNLTFDDLELILEKTAFSFPFENLCIITDQIKPVTKENLMNKLLVNHEGGLRYELNPLLYFFLLENGFHVHLIRANVFNSQSNSFSSLGKTHVAILLNHEKQTYVIETGFGGNLPLKPVPLTGQLVTSMT